MLLATPQFLLVGAVAAVGVLHTMVPDHWVPITLVARQRGWTKGQTARAALLAGTGHVVTTLLIAAVVWFGGVAAAKHIGEWVDTLASLALVAFGGWIAISSLLAMRGPDGGHGHSHRHAHGHPHAVDGDLDEQGIHGPELQRIGNPDGPVDVSIFESGMPPHFRLSGANIDRATIVTTRPDGRAQSFICVRRAGYWESAEEIPEPHEFSVTVWLEDGDHQHAYPANFSEHDHQGHGHHHNPVRPKASSRTALLLILGSSPMVEGIPAFFAAGKYGGGLVILMSLVFAAATIVTYVVLCVGSVVGLKRVSLGPLERYGEVLSGALIAVIGLVFWAWPLFTSRSG